MTCVKNKSRRSSLQFQPGNSVKPVKTQQNVVKFFRKVSGEFSEKDYVAPPGWENFSHPGGALWVGGDREKDERT